MKINIDGLERGIISAMEYYDVPMEKQKSLNGSGYDNALYTKTKLKNAVEKYFEKTTKPTLAGLAVHLGVVRNTVANYAKKDDLAPIIHMAKTRIEAHLEEQMQDKNTYSPGQFAILKNGYGWSDKVETKNETDTTVRMDPSLSSAVREVYGLSVEEAQEVVRDEVDL